MAAPGTPVIAGGKKPLGYQQILAATLATATALTIPTGATIALVIADTAAVRWRDDGTAPTQSAGVYLASGTYLEFTANLASLKFILNTGGSPVLNISYY